MDPKCETSKKMKSSDSIIYKYEDIEITYPINYEPNYSQNEAGDLINNYKVRII